MSNPKNELHIAAMASFHNPLEDVIKDAQRKQMQQIASVEASRLKKEKEE